MTIDLKLNQPQWEALNSTARETFMVGGVGMGKSFLLAVALFKHINENPGTTCMVAAPTYGVLTKATLRQIQPVWAKLGWVEGIGGAYVVNRKPPVLWGIEPFSVLDNKNILTTRNGSYVVLASLDNPNTMRGGEFDMIFVDEFRDVPNDAREVLLGRLRGKLFTQKGKKHRILYVTTPPDNPTLLKSILDQANEELKIVTGTSWANAHNLPEGYLEALRRSYDEATYEREVLGRLVFLNTNPFFYSFKEEQHVAPTRYSGSGKLVLSFDFNVDPLTCIAVEQVGDYVQVLREWRQRDSDLYRLCEELRGWIGARRIEVTGDATGANRSPMLKQNLHAYEIIRRELNLSITQINVKKSNPPHQASLVICNSVIARGIKLVIDPSCKYLIEDLKAVRVGEGNKIKIDDPKQGHLLDCFRYYLHNYWGHKVPKSSYALAKATT